MMTIEKERKIRNMYWQLEWKLDKYGGEELGPYRYERQKLERRKRRLMLILEGKDPRFQATGEIAPNRGLTIGERADVRMRRAVARILEDISNG